MCTAFIYRNPETHFCFLGFNRDESIKRKKAISPSIENLKNLDILCPRDGDFGGTWIGVNSHGEIFAILNYYEAELKLIRNPVSRGLLLRGLLKKDLALGDIEVQKLAEYYPFRILQISFSVSILFEWDGKKISIFESSDRWQVIGSSFTMGQKAEDERKKLFAVQFLPRLNQKEDVEKIASQFLTSHEPEKGSLSPCMHKTIARTISQTLISLNENLAVMKYKNGPPCELDQFEEQRMPIIRQ